MRTFRQTMWLKLPSTLIFKSNERKDMNNISEHMIPAAQHSMPAPITEHIMPAPYVTVKLAAAMTGLSQKAIRRKMENGKWLEGREYRRSPDGGIFISIKGFTAWLEKPTV